MGTSETPSAFISYTHENEAHKSWVRRLSEDLVHNGVVTTLDQWDLHIGDDIGSFMENSIKNSRYVILVCTPTYGAKANNRQGGVGYEQAVFIGSILLSGRLDPRFIPIIRSGEPAQALPVYLQSRLFIDFRDDNTYSQSLEQMVRGLFGAPAYTRPSLGSPAFLNKNARNPSEMAPPLLNSGPPRGWILVAGTGNAASLTTKTEQTATALGTALAGAGFGLVTGGWRGVDELAARAFARELSRSNVPLENRLIQVVRKDRVPGFAAGELVLVHPGEEEWTESVRRAEAVVLVGGIGGTWETGQYALKFGRLALPLPDTGGDASKFYMYMQRNWKSEFAAGLEKTRFSVISREAPGVVTELIKLLDDWTDQKSTTSQ